MAKARYIRMSPRKVRLVIDVVRGLPVAEAVRKLEMMPQSAVRPVLKVIQSAAANGENNLKLKKDDLYIKSVVADQGPTLKRWRARAMGRAAMIRKRTTHITVVLSDGKDGADEKEAGAGLKKAEKPLRKAPRRKPQ